MPVENNQSHMICVRVPLVLYEQLLAASRGEGLGLSNMVCKCLRYALRDRDVAIAHQRSMARMELKKKLRKAGERA